jgi:hypothetical protein
LIEILKTFLDVWFRSVETALIKQLKPLIATRVKLEDESAECGGNWIAVLILLT